MRRLLYPLAFALVLLLAGSAIVLGHDVPTGGGTVPDGGHTLWLPVVEGEPLSRACPYIPMPLYPDIGAINPAHWAVQVLTIGEGGLMIWDTVFTAHTNDQSSNALDTWSSYATTGAPLTASYNPKLPPGEYCWRARFVCYGGKYYEDGGRTEGCRAFRIER